MMVPICAAYLCCPFSHQMSWIRSWTKLGKFRSVSLPTLELLKERGMMWFPTYSCTIKGKRYDVVPYLLLNC